ncbi:GAF domain-containing protein [Streptomyces sp. GD-15H]|uniref:GAF domain-containing protein n=1 Tax=Streptomyces sp. GD-15H TaxID=3129112 RepID=UPI0032562B8E
MTAEVMKAVRLVAEAAAGAPDEEVPRRVCAAVCEGLGVDGATLSLLTDTPSRQLLAASNDAALLLEEIQFTVLEGPCISAARTGEPVAVADLRHELTLWPLFGAMVREKLPHVGSVYALPLSSATTSSGRSTCWRCDPTLSVRTPWSRRPPWPTR